MTSSAFSIKRFDTLSPDICTRPPLPPVVPPPPIAQATFSVFASIDPPTGSLPMVYASGVTLTVVPGADYWQGESTPRTDVRKLIAYLWRIPLTPDWQLRVVFREWQGSGHIFDWYNQTFQGGRPYVATTLNATVGPTSDPVIASLRETPA